MTKTKGSMAVFIVLICVMACQVSARILDLTWVQQPNSPAWPGNKPFKITPIRKEQTPMGFWIEFNWYSTSEHKGTHIDAPNHFIKDAPTIDKVPMERLHGPGVVFRAHEEAKNNSDFAITKEWLEVWESKHGRIPEKSIVFMDFNWGREDHDMKLLVGSENVDDPSTFHYPGISVDGVEFLVKERNIYCLGTDAVSVDPGFSKTFPGHLILLGNNVTILENVAHLDKLPVTGAHIVAAPIKLLGGSGGQTRVIAFVDEDPMPSSACNLCMQFYCVVWF